MDRISIVMATYNGETFLLDQLNSLRNQTVSVDQIIIMDDRSTDKTVQIAQEFIDQYHLTGWQIHVNENNIGWKANFKNGFDLAEGDFIFPCDQDDIWHADKCEKMVACMKEHPDLELLVSNYEIKFYGTDNGSKAYDRQAREMLDDGSFQMLPIDEKWPYITRPGCTFCFTKKYYDRIKDQWDIYFAHDAILWRLARLNHHMGILNSKLIDFRRHGNNATSNVKRTRESEIETFEGYLKFYEIGLSMDQDAKSMGILQKGTEFLQHRIRFYQTRNLLQWFALVMNYQKYYLTYRGWLGDLYFVILKG